MDKPCPPEEYAAALARYLVAKYPRVSRARVTVEQAPWQRFVSSGGGGGGASGGSAGGGNGASGGASGSASGSASGGASGSTTPNAPPTPTPHDHCYVAGGTEVRTARAVAEKGGALDVRAGVKDLKILKTTQSGYSGFLRDAHTALADCDDRMMATSVTAEWRYDPARVQGPSGAFDYDAAFCAARSGLLDAAFGPPRGGVFSPSVQYTLFEMAGLAMRRSPHVESVFLNMPNLHFIPAQIKGPASQDNSFADDVYVATSEPHGAIEALVTRRLRGGFAPPHLSKL